MIWELINMCIPSYNSSLLAKTKKNMFMAINLYEQKVHLNLTKKIEATLQIIQATSCVEKYAESNDSCVLSNHVFQILKQLAQAVVCFSGTVHESSNGLNMYKLERTRDVIN